MEEHEFRREADDLVRIWGELGRRVGQSGLRGIPDVIEMHAELRAVTERIAQEEIDLALTHIASLTDQLRTLRTRMSQLGELKEKLLPAGEI